MYEGCPVDLKMEKVVSIDAVFDEEVHCAKVYKYDMEEDFIRLLLEGENLSVISLDAKYECVLSCSGTVKERFQCEAGDMLIFKIENGFYTVSSDGK